MSMFTLKKTASEKQQGLGVEVKERLSMNFMSFSTEDKFFSLTCWLIITTSWHMYGRLMALALIGVWLLLMCRPENGRIYYTFGQYWYSSYIRHVRKHVLWQAQPPPTRFDKLRKQQSDPDDDDGYLPFKTGVIGDNFGFVDFGGADVIVIEGDGSNIISQSPTDQYQTSLRKAELIKRVASSVKGFNIAVSFVYRRRPPNVHKLADNFGEILHPDVAVPEALVLIEQGIPEEEWNEEQKVNYYAYQDYMESLELAAQSSGQVTMAMVITLERDAKLVAAIKGKGSLDEEDLSRLTISRVARTAKEGLKAVGVSNPRVLNLEQINLFVRQAWDVTSIGSYYTLMQEEWNEPGELARSKLHYPQERMLAFEDYCVVDGTWISVLRIRGQPPKILYDYYRELHAMDIPWLTVSLVGETVSYKGEYRIVSRVIGAKEAFDDVRGVIRKAPHTRKKAEERAKREEDLFNSRFAQAYCILVAIAHGSKRELDDGVDEAMSTLHKMGMSATRIKSEARQMPAMWSANTGIPML